MKVKIEYDDGTGKVREVTLDRPVINFDFGTREDRPGIVSFWWGRTTIFIPKERLIRADVDMEIDPPKH